MKPKPIRIDLDIAIIGGGVAGLWLTNRCVAEGYSAALFEAKALGSDQSLASQGMIHGGMKYTLAGALTGASEAIADMPKHWRACLCGEGDVDLRHTRILSDHFFLWSSDSLASKLTNFLASKITRGRLEAVHPDRRPPLLRRHDFKGSLYRLEDIVIDTPSLIANLANNVEANCFQLDWTQARLKKDTQGTLSLAIENPEQPLEIHAQRFVFTAGKGNGELMQQLDLAQPAMQLRPLQQLMVKHHYPFDFYGHCLGAETTPRLTISSHRLPDGARIWYLGGSLAEKGATMDPAALIELAKTELAELIPWINLNNAEWATLPIARAEPEQPGFARPDNAFIQHVEGTANLLLGWPTKLTLAPNLANEALKLFSDAQLIKTCAPLSAAPATGKGAVSATEKNVALKQLREHLALPSLAKTPWELAFPPAMSPEEVLELRFRHELYEDYEIEVEVNTKNNKENT